MLTDMTVTKYIYIKKVCLLIRNHFDQNNKDAHTHTHTQSKWKLVNLKTYSTYINTFRQLAIYSMIIQNFNKI